MDAEEREMAWGIGLFIAVIVVAILIVVCGLRWLTGSWIAAAIVAAVLIGAGGFVPIYNGYSTWGGLRLLLTTNWKY